MTLDEIFNKHGADKGSIGHGFSKRYEPLFEPLRNEPVVLLECGIQFGCSANAFVEYFTRGSVYGVDCLNEHRVSSVRFFFEVGNQRDPAFWSSWKSRNPQPHIIIDDAEHRADASRIMFSEMWPHLRHGGVYAVEDVCTWFDPNFSSPLQGSDWIKELFADVNWHGSDYSGKPGGPKVRRLAYLEDTLDSIHASKHLLILIKK